MATEEQKIMALSQALSDMIIDASRQVNVDTEMLVMAVITKLAREMYEKVGYEQSAENMQMILNVMKLTNVIDTDKAKKATDQIIRGMKA